LKGVTGVQSGFKGAREINTVTYDQSVISIKELEQILRNVGTYRGTVK